MLGVEKKINVPFRASTGSVGVQFACAVFRVRLNKSTSHETTIQTLIEINYSPVCVH
jgi:hypothetical protein